MVHGNTSQKISSITQWHSSIDSHEFLKVQNCFQKKPMKILNCVNEFNQQKQLLELLRSVFFFSIPNYVFRLFLEQKKYTA